VASAKSVSKSVLPKLLLTLAFLFANKFVDVWHASEMVLLYVAIFITDRAVRTWIGPLLFHVTIFLCFLQYVIRFLDPTKGSVLHDYLDFCGLIWTNLGALPHFMLIAAAPHMRDRREGDDGKRGEGGTRERRGRDPRDKASPDRAAFGGAGDAETAAGNELDTVQALPVRKKSPQARKKSPTASPTASVKKARKKLTQKEESQRQLEAGGGKGGAEIDSSFLNTLCLAYGKEICAFLVLIQSLIRGSSIYSVFFILGFFLMQAPRRSFWFHALRAKPEEIAPLEEKAPRAKQDGKGRENLASQTGSAGTRTGKKSEKRKKPAERRALENAGDESGAVATLGTQNYYWRAPPSPEMPPTVLTAHEATLRFYTQKSGNRVHVVFFVNYCAGWFLMILLYQCVVNTIIQCPPIRKLPFFSSEGARSSEQERVEQRNAILNWLDLRCDIGFSWDYFFVSIWQFLSYYFICVGKLWWNIGCIHFAHTSPGCGGGRKRNFPV
jgi:hypothetical protein